MKILLLLILLLPSCNLGTSYKYDVSKYLYNKSDIQNLNYSYVDSRLLPYLNEFIKEAGDRNVPIDLTGLRMRVGDTSNPNYYAEALIHNSDKPRNIEVAFRPDTLTMDTKFLRWLVFHELGHAILALQHRSDQEAIMNTGGVVTNPYLELTDQTRIDELFKPYTTIAPSK